jgi:hypothetical protein
MLLGITYSLLEVGHLYSTPNRVGYLAGNG